ncbi:MAG: hypothetical protein J0I12_08155 [Candidatus Eremiobacteraeota bacterium]|nr:hypothetical protein [Candidatus Eremiobacteraeota bacterium]
MQIHGLPQLPVLRPAATAVPAKTVEETGLDPTKCDLIDSMIRALPGPEQRQQLQAALQGMPTEALARIAQYGTALEVYDKNAPGIPLYAQHLKKPNCDGAYSPTANVVFVDQNNITPLVLLHELSHALDMALGEVSKNPEWVAGRDQARATRACIRPYATHNSAEYLADNLAAHLIPDQELPSMLRARLRQQPQLDKMEVVREHVNYCQGKQKQVDATAFQLCADLLNALPGLPEALPRPALTPQEYLEAKRAELQRLKGS